MVLSYKLDSCFEYKSEVVNAVIKGTASFYKLGRIGIFTFNEVAGAGGDKISLVCPKWFKPKHRVSFVATSFNSPTEVTLYTDGNITIFSTNTGLSATCPVILEE